MPSSSSLSEVKHIILVLSGKGGVGKSSVTTQLALSLSLAGRSVGVLDVDLTGPNIPRFFGVETAKVTQAPGGWIPVTVHGASTLPPLPVPPPAPSSAAVAAAPQQQQPSPSPASAPSSSPSQLSSAPSPPPPLQLLPSVEVGELRCMSLAFLLRDRGDAVVWRGPKKTAMVRQFLTDVHWGALDYLLIDTPPGTSDEHISLVENLLRVQQEQQQQQHQQQQQQQHPEKKRQEEQASHQPPPPPPQPQLAGAVVVTTPQAVATADVRKELNFCAKTRVPVLGVLENMSGFVCPHCSACTHIFAAAAASVGGGSGGGSGGGGGGGGSGGGGRALARDFGVRFLGSVPLDAQFVALVEQGRLPTYPAGTGAALTASSSSSSSSLLATTVLPIDASPTVDSAISAASSPPPPPPLPSLPSSSSEMPLVQKYRLCSLAPLFQKLAGDLISAIEHV